MKRLAVWCVLVAISSVASAVPAQRVNQGEKKVFDQASMESLRFLEGRWTGTAPDGSVFYEAYDRIDPVTLRSSRYKDASFAERTDGSVVELKDGQITSTWGEYVWRASKIADGLASFEPVNAPSAFTWKQLDANTVEVTQKWVDEKGAAQSYALKLERVR